ncbi:MAG TPA: OmpH family outer membrane protein [Nitrospiraceae bacterium]|jgi:outer membrane protein|nr:OmpH family outer membrane protein [Nitrospiraceae bacterium]
MITRRNGLAAAGLLAWMLCLGAGVQAADTFKVAVIDRQGVLEKTKSGKRTLDAMKEFAKSRERILAADEEELRGLEKELQSQTAGLSEVAKREKQEHLSGKFQGYQRRRQEFTKEIQAKQKELGDEYEKKIKEVVSDLAQKEGYTAILDKGSEAVMKIVIYNQSGIDLTDRVVKEFDRRYP